MAKKNFVRQSVTNRINEAVGFTYPKLHCGKTIYVDYYVHDPASGEMKRVKKHFDRFKKKRERDAAINHFIGIISEKLRQGWNPYANSGNKGLTTVNLIFQRYIDSLIRYTRQKTRSNYESRMNIFKKFISELSFPPN